METPTKRKPLADGLPEKLSDNLKMVRLISFGGYNRVYETTTRLVYYASFPAAAKIESSWLVVQKPFINYSMHIVMKWDHPICASLAGLFDKATTNGSLKWST